MKTPINKKDYDNWQKKLAEAAKIAPPLEDRIDYIINTIAKAHDAQISCWYFHGAPEGSIGDIMANIDDEWVSNLEIDFESCNCLGSYRNNPAILRGGEAHHLLSRFPTRWLFEDFEKELEYGLKLFKDNEKAEEEKVAKKQAAKLKKKNELAQKARAKLTEEELKALLG